MSRRKAAPKRHILPDPLFNTEIIAKFINCVMEDGKKSVAERIVYGALIQVLTRQKDQQEESSDESALLRKTDSSAAAPFGVYLSQKAKESAVKIFLKALNNVSPAVEVKSRRVGGSNYQVPVEVRPERRTTLGMRWLIEYANARNEKTMVIRLATEQTRAIHQSTGKGSYLGRD